jgi:hypothetical protein
MKNLIFSCLLLFPFAGFAGPAPVVEEVYELWFSIGQVQHHALLLRSGSAWEMRVQFQDPSCNCQQVIEEKFAVENCKNGLKLRGHSVKNLKQSTGMTQYAADNLYLYFRPNGAVYASNIDNAGEVASLSIQSVKTTEKRKMLQDFQWGSN